MDGALWLKALHIMAFTAWIAGMWYLPRLFIYHTDVAVGSEASETFKVMERRLLRAITTPAMVVTLLAGVALASAQGQWAEGWLHVKALAGAWDAGLSRYPRPAMSGAFRPTSDPSQATWYRVFNEVPTLLFIGIVLLAVLKPW